MTVYVIFISVLLLEIAVGDELLRPENKCVPTATIQGPCHVCVCGTDGIYYCRETACQEEVEKNDQSTTECEPKQMYRQGLSFCSCTASGHWRSINCRALLHRLLLKKDPIKKNIRTTIPCKPDQLYVTDCNVCLCKPSGFINFDSCTTRPCLKRHKGDHCSSGDVYRSANDFCVCSHLNFFVDRLCLKVNEDAIQPISLKDVDKIIDVKTYHVEKVCEKNETFTKDCNDCFCYTQKIVCTSRKCINVELREGKLNMKNFLPTLKSEHSKCTPGKKYKYKCNTCFCNRNEEPICTSMICLQDLKVDTAALRQMIISY